MINFSALLERGRQFFASPKRRNGLFLALFCLILILIIRGCSSSPFHNNVYTIGQDVQWSSLNVMNKERELSALNLDLLSAIAKQENVKFSLFPIASNSLIRLLETKELDGIISALPPTPINQSIYTFSEPFFPLGPVLIISARSPLKGWNEMAVKIIGVQSNVQMLLNLEKNPSIQLRLYDNILSALADLDDHRIDGVIFPALPAYIYTNTFYEGKLKIATAPLTDESLRLIALKNERGQQLINTFNQGLKELQTNGTYHQLLSRWGFMDFEKIEEN